MRTLIAAAFVTLDGVMQAPGAPEEDPASGFRYGGWSVPFWDDVMGAAEVEQFRAPVDHLLGRRTYEIFAAHWPFVAGEGDEVDAVVASALNGGTKYVASRTLQEVSWQGSILLRGDAATAVAELKEQDGPDLLLQGSTELLQSLLAADLVDELRIWTFPVVVGSGKRLFGPGTAPGSWSAVEVTTSSTGVVMATYRRSGTLEFGSFALEQPTPEEEERRRRLAEEEAG